MLLVILLRQSITTASSGVAPKSLKSIRLLYAVNHNIFRGYVMAIGRYVKEKGVLACWRIIDSQ